MQATFFELVAQDDPTREVGVSSGIHLVRDLLERFLDGQARLWDGKAEDDLAQQILLLV